MPTKLGRISTAEARAIAAEMRANGELSAAPAPVRFETGKTYQTRSPCDSDCIIRATIAKRTARTVTTTAGKTFRVSEYAGVEQFKPWGAGSMMPIMSAERAVS